MTFRIRRIHRHVTEALTLSLMKVERQKRRLPSDFETRQKRRLLSGFETRQKRCSLWNLRRGRKDERTLQLEQGKFRASKR